MVLRVNGMSFGCQPASILRYVPYYWSCELGFIKRGEFLYCQIFKPTGDALHWQDCDREWLRNVAWRSLAVRAAASKFLSTDTVYRGSDLNLMLP